MWLSWLSVIPSHSPPPSEFKLTFKCACVYKASVPIYTNSQANRKLSAVENQHWQRGETKWEPALWEQPCLCWQHLGSWIKTKERKIRVSQCWSTPAAGLGAGSPEARDEELWLGFWAIWLGCPWERLWWKEPRAAFGRNLVWWPGPGMRCCKFRCFGKAKMG